MALACVTGSAMRGWVPHHANHIIDWSCDEYYCVPIYCSGHDVYGETTKPNQGKLSIQGKMALVISGGGWSNDACDGSDFVATKGSSSLFIQGKPIMRVNDEVRLYPGEGKMVTSNQNKFHVRR